MNEWMFNVGSNQLVRPPLVTTAEGCNCSRMSLTMIRLPQHALPGQTDGQGIAGPQWGTWLLGELYPVNTNICRLWVIKLNKLSTVKKGREESQCVNYHCNVLSTEMMVWEGSIGQYWPHSKGINERVNEWTSNDTPVSKTGFLFYWYLSWVLYLLAFPPLFT